MNFKKYLVVIFLLQSLVGMIHAQESIEEIAKLSKLKKLYQRSPEFNLKYFEADPQTSFYGRASVTSTDWTAEFGSEDLEKLKGLLQNNINLVVSKNPRPSKSKKDYYRLELKIEFDNIISREFLNISFEPTEVLLGDEPVALYPEAAKNGMTISTKGNVHSTGLKNVYQQIIPIGIESDVDLMAPIKVKGKIKIELTEKMKEFNLKKNKEIVVLGETYELLDIQEGRAFIRGHNKKGVEKPHFKCEDEEGLKACGMMFSQPVKLYDYYSKGRASFVEEEYLALVESLTIDELENGDWVKIIDSNLFLEEVLIFAPAKTLMDEFAIEKTVN